MQAKKKAAKGSLAASPCVRYSPNAQQLWTAATAGMPGCKQALASQRHECQGLCTKKGIVQREGVVLGVWQASGCRATSTR